MIRDTYYSLIFLKNFCLFGVTLIYGRNSSALVCDKKNTKKNSSQIATYDSHVRDVNFLSR